VTFEQLRIFVAVAEREHLTQAATALHLTPSAVSAAIKALEGFYRVRLFERVGRGIELTGEGRIFLEEARQTLARVRAAERVLGELGDLSRGSVDLHASQTIANYWLPPRLMRFHALHPGIDVRLTIGNTSAVSRAVIEGSAELGFIEGTVEQPALSSEAVAEDRLVIVTRAQPQKGPSASETILSLDWVLREPGSGTRSEFEAALARLGVDPKALQVAMVLPSNEAVLSAVRAGQAATALSRAVVAPFLADGELRALDIDLPPRKFTLVSHRERHLSSAAARLAELCRAEDGGPR
jgi:Transcriptional regulator